MFNVISKCSIHLCVVSNVVICNTPYSGVGCAYIKEVHWYLSNKIKTALITHKPRGVSLSVAIMDSCQLIQLLGQGRI